METHHKQLMVCKHGFPGVRYLVLSRLSDYVPNLVSFILSSTARLLTGVAGSDAWLCLSNAHALAPAVTSVLAQQLNVLKQVRSAQSLSKKQSCVAFPIERGGSVRRYA